MKRYNNLWDKIVSKENFKLAFKNATKGKKHYYEVERYSTLVWNRRLEMLRRKVRAKTYRVSEYHVFKRFTGGKEREIYKLPMTDRIVQHALMNIIEPIFRESFIVDTFSSIKGRGIHHALKRIKRATKDKDSVYYLKLDIKKCYPSLDKTILKTKLHKKFKDKNVQWLLDVIIDSCEQGVPIGNYTSQYFNNFYFNDFDHWIKEIKGVKYYYRYCDDMVIIGKSKEELHALFEEIKIKIAELNVTLKDNYQIYDINTRSINFIGYKTRNTHTLVRNHIKRSFINKLKDIDLNNLTERDINVLGSYWGIFVHANCRNLWYKYTKVKSFKDLNIDVHKRDFVRCLIDIPLIITSGYIFQKRGVDWLKFECTYEGTGKTGEKKTFKDVLVSTSGEVLVEAGHRFNQNTFPFKTTIIINDKGFYEFT